MGAPRRPSSLRPAVAVTVGLLLLSPWAPPLLIGSTVVDPKAILGTTSWVLLDPTGPTGCRAVVEESSFLMAGSGRVGTVGRLGLLDLQSDVTTDDGGTPASDGGYRVGWQESEAVVELTGSSGQLVWPTLHEVGC